MRLDPGGSQDSHSGAHAVREEGPPGTGSFLAASANEGARSECSGDKHHPTCLPDPIRPELPGLGKKLESHPHHQSPPVLSSCPGGGHFLLIKDTSRSLWSLHCGMDTGLVVGRTKFRLCPQAGHVSICPIMSCRPSEMPPLIFSLGSFWNRHIQPVVCSNGVLPSH